MFTHESLIMFYNDRRNHKETSTRKQFSVVKSAGSRWEFYDSYIIAEDLRMLVETYAVEHNMITSIRAEPRGKNLITVKNGLFYKEHYIVTPDVRRCSKLAMQTQHKSVNLPSVLREIKEYFDCKLYNAFEGMTI
jgi:hypothetical protein